MVAIHETDDVAESEALTAAPHARLKHSRASRWMHWINFPVLAIMIFSGFRIYWANDVYTNDETGWWWIQPFVDVAEALNPFAIRAKLSRGMAFHFALGWVFALNGIAFAAYLISSGEWRYIVPDRKAWRESIDVVLHDLRIRKTEPVHGRYNAAQQISYTAVLLMGALVVLTGLAMYKPIQLRWLTAAFGGYETARLIHFVTTLGFMAFFVVHIVQVARSGWGNFTSMITGYEKIQGGRRGK